MLLYRERTYETDLMLDLESITGRLERLSELIESLPLTLPLPEQDCHRLQSAVDLVVAEKAKILKMIAAL